MSFQWMVPIIRSSMKPLEVSSSDIWTSEAVVASLYGCDPRAAVQDMDLSRMTERLLRLAVSKNLWFPVFPLTRLFPAHRLSVCALRCPTTCCGWCFSTGSFTHPWTSRPSCCASVTGSSTTTGGVFTCLCEGRASQTDVLVDCCSIIAEKL